MREIPWDFGLFMKHSRGLDMALFNEAAKQIESEALQACGGDAQLAYKWLRKNGGEISKRVHPFAPGYVETGLALVFVQENLYWHISKQDMDSDLLEELTEHYYRQALVEGGGTKEGALEWLTAKMPEVVQENLERHSDFLERNKAFGGAQKRLQLELYWKPAEPSGQASDDTDGIPRHPNHRTDPLATIRSLVIQQIWEEPGLSDREITDRVKSHKSPQQYINQVCRSLASEGLIERRLRQDGLLGNFPQVPKMPTEQEKEDRILDENDHELSEDEVKAIIQEWLERSGWQVEVAWGKERGMDLDASRQEARWIVEVKGAGAKGPMRVNYFLHAIGEILQRMDDESAKYSIAFPHIRQFLGLWERLPKLAKDRATLTALFVRPDGHVEELA